MSAMPKKSVMALHITTHTSGRRKTAAAEFERDGQNSRKDCRSAQGRVRRGF